MVICHLHLYLRSLAGEFGSETTNAATTCAHLAGCIEMLVMVKILNQRTNYDFKTKLADKLKC
jgi:hypothetical protein